MLVVLSLSSCTYYFSNSRVKRFDNSGNNIPEIVEEAKQTFYDVSLKDQPLVHYWANKEYTNWSRAGAKVGSPRAMIAKLALGQEVDSINAFIQTLEPWGRPGSHYFLNPKGDYDFTEVPLCILLYYFADDTTKLYPSTAKYIADNLLVHQGGKIKEKAPRTLRMQRETENHIFMAHTSMYLKNQWLKAHGSTDEKYDNEVNGLEQWWLDHLEMKISSGFYEFNSSPYFGYSATALMTLHAFTISLELKQKIEDLFYILNLKYAYGSNDLRRYAPFRRRASSAKKPQLNYEPQTALMLTWREKARGIPVDLDKVPNARHQAFIAVLLPYQPSEKVLQLSSDKPVSYFAKFGHGLKASPEIYSGGQRYVLSAGGVQRGKRSQVAARPTVLFLNDTATLLSSCFYLSGKGEMGAWNNTGVYHRFAVTNGKLHIPDQHKPIYSKEGWKVFAPYSGNEFLLVTYSNSDVSLLAVFPNNTIEPQNLLDRVITINQSGQLKYTFLFPKGDQIAYDLKAHEKFWVINKVNGEEIDRRHNKWPVFHLEEY